MAALLDFRSDGVQEHRALVDDVYQERALGCIVRGLVGDDEIRAALERLSPEAPKHEVVPNAHTFGVMLAPTATQPLGPTFDAYLSSATAWSAADLFDASAIARLESALSGLAANR